MTFPFDEWRTWIPHLWRGSWAALVGSATLCTYRVLKWLSIMLSLHLKRS